MADWKCKCGGIYQNTGGDYNPRDTKCYLKCDKCGDKFMAFWMNPEYEYTIKWTKIVKPENKNNENFVTK